LGGLLSLQHAVLAAPTQAAYTREVRRPLLGGSYAFAERHVAVERVEQLLAALPAAWVDAARLVAAAPAAGRPAPPAPAVVLAAMLLPRLGWQPPGRQPVPLGSLAVRDATALLTAGAAAERAVHYLVPYAELAAGIVAPVPPPPLPPPSLPPLSPPSPPLTELHRALRRLWRLPWENGRKETFWRLVYDALPTAARLHSDQPCPCGAPAQRPGRQHHFWECPIARGVVSQLEAAMAATALATAPPPAPLTLAHIWLARPPPGLHADLWGVVCLAAVEAMAHGMRRLTGMVLRRRERLRQQQQGQPQPQQQHQPQPSFVQLTLDGWVLPGGGAAPPDPPPPHTADNASHPSPDPAEPSGFISTATRCACKFFWTLLADFVALDCAPASWLASLPSSHPFFHVVAGRLQLRPLPLP
jgi:hypothetical protein